ncbi:MAG: Holliday junction resolvase RuvX [Patescibacteria group bacterium]|nr:Holliday junction resolvase RuvX [Patescibacteria group bacterium]
MKYLAIDWGMKKAGLAFSEGKLATPLQVIHFSNFATGIQTVTKIARQQQVDILVVGLPEGQMGQAVRKAARQLQEEGFKVEFADETLSSQQAQKIMIEEGNSKKDRREEDKVAAALILQNFLDRKND